MSSSLDPIGDDPAKNTSEFLDIAMHLSNMLGTELTQEQLSIVIELLNYGANSEELAKLILNLRKDAHQKQHEIAQMFKPADLEVERDWTYHQERGVLPVSRPPLLPPTNIGTRTNPPAGRTDCSYDGKLYLDKERIPVGNRCIHCFCQAGKFKCFRQNCPPPPIDCELMSDDSDVCKFPIYNCTIPERHQMPLLEKDTQIYGQRHPGMGLVKGDCIIRGIAYFTGETVGLATSDCLQCRCARNSLLCIALCCYEPVTFGRDSNQLIGAVYHRALHQRDPHPLDHLD